MGSRLPGPRRRVALALLAAAALIAGAVTAVVVVSGGGGEQTAVVSAQGVQLRFGEFVVDGPPGVAPVGTVLTARETTAVPTQVAGIALPGRVGVGIALDLAGRQPDRPLRITFPTGGTDPSVALPALLTKPSDSDEAHLLPATSDPTARTASALVTHLSDFWTFALSVPDFVGAVLAGLVGRSARPECHGRPAMDDAGEISIRPVNGDPVWVCVRAQGDRFAVDLINNSPPAWYIEAAPNARLEPQGATELADTLAVALAGRLYAGRSRAPGVLPTHSRVTYTFPRASLPAAISLQPDPGPFLVSALASVIATGAEVFPPTGLARKALLASSVVSCLATVVEASEDGLPPPNQVASVLRAGLKCFELIADGVVIAVITALGAGIGLLATGISSILATLGGPQKINIVASASARTDPCASTEAFRQTVELVDPQIFAPAKYGRVLSVQCVAGHPIGLVAPLEDGTGADQLVLVPQRGSWRIVIIYHGDQCAGTTELPPPVEKVVCS